MNVAVTMRGRITLLLSFLVIGAGSVAHGQEWSRDAFSERTLYDRFDADGDGQLNSRERTALRDAFGGIDIPMLPNRLFDYRTTRLPACAVHTGVESTDNTPPHNPLTDAGATLGRVLFYDKQLSLNRSVACASCHHQALAFSDARPFSIGFLGEATSRNAMGLANLRFTNLKRMRPGFFWDERAATLEDQILMPIQDKTEMGMALPELEARLAALPYYPPLFAAAFGTPDVTSDRIARAVAQFLRAMVAFDSKFDRATTHHMQEESSAVSNSPRNSRSEESDRAMHHMFSKPFADFTAQENLGKSLFMDGARGVAEFGCATCHMPPTFGMPKAFNNGLDLEYRDQGLGLLGRPSNAPFTRSNDGKFKAPSLRNIELTAPYMHDGRFKALDEVVAHYSNGIQRHENLGLAFDEPGRNDADRPTLGFHFTAEQKAALVAFLKTLTDSRFLTDPRFSDPFLREPEEVDEAHAAAESPSETYQRLLREYEDGTEARLLASQFLELASQHASDPIAMDSLVWVLSKLRNRPEAIRAIELVERDHLKADRLATACAAIARVPATQAETVLQKALEESPHRQVRAQACLHWAALLDQQSIVLDELRKQPEARNRLLQYYSKDYGKHLTALEPTSLDKKREQVYEQLLKSFGDLPHTAGESKGSVAEAEPAGTMAKVAEKALFQIRHLSIGRQAPEIDGEDIFGNKFKLSDYRGKVVVLSFWGHW